MKKIEDVFFWGVPNGFEAIPVKYRDIAHQKHYNTKFSGNGVKVERVDSKIWLSYVNYEFLNVNGRPNSSFGFTFVIENVMPTQFEAIGAFFDVLFQSLIKQLDFAFPVAGAKGGYQFRPEFSRKFYAEYPKLVDKFIEAFEQNVPLNSYVTRLEFEKENDQELFNIADKNIDLILERFAFNGRVCFNKTAPPRKQSAIRIRTSFSDEVKKLQEQILVLSEENNMLKRDSTKQKIISTSEEAFGGGRASFSNELEEYPVRKLKLISVSFLLLIVAGYFFYQQSRILEKLDNLDKVLEKNVISQAPSKSQKIQAQQPINSPVEKKKVIIPEWLTFRKNRFYVSSNFLKILSETKPDSSEFSSILVEKFANNLEFFTTCFAHSDSEEFLKSVYALNPAELGKLSKGETLKWRKYKVTENTVIGNFPETNECIGHLEASGKE